MDNMNACAGRRRRRLAAMAGVALAIVLATASSLLGRPALASATDAEPLAAAAGTAADVRAIEFAVGASEGQRNFNWLGTSGADSYVQIAEQPAGWQAGDAFPEASARSIKATQAEAQRAGYRSNKATVDGIQGGVSYVYRVGNEECWSDAYAFTASAQGSGTSFNFLFAGDPQVGASGNSGADEAGWTNTLNRALARLGGASFVASAGDQVNNRGDEEQYDGYYAPEALKSVPQATTVGNHDNGSLRYTDYNNMPNVSELGATKNTGSQSGDYWFMYNGVLFMDLNSNNTSTSEHRQFMADAIAANPQATWKIVMFHHSTYSVANHYTDGDIIQRRNELPAVFSDLDIDVVLMGHDHYFTRTYLIEDGNPVVPEGHDISKGEPAPTEAVDPEPGQVLYLTANSASGSKYYSLNGDLAAAGLPGYVAVQDQSSRQSITNVTVDGSSLKLDTYYTSSDEIELMDSFTIRRADGTDPDAPNNGGQDGNGGQDNGNGNQGGNGQDNGNGSTGQGGNQDGSGTDQNGSGQNGSGQDNGNGGSNQGGDGQNGNGGSGSQGGSSQNGGQGGSSQDAGQNGSGSQTGAPSSQTSAQKPASGAKAPSRAQASALPHTGDVLSLPAVAAAVLLGGALIGVAAWRLRHRV